MAIDFTNSFSSLFSVLGRLGGMVAKLSTYQGDLKSIMVGSPNGLSFRLQAESDIQAIVGDSYQGILSSAGSSVGGFVQQIAAAYLNRVVLRDAQQSNQSLTQLNTLASIQEVIRQMKLEGASVLAMNVTGSAGNFVGLGNGVLSVSTKRPSDGLTQENAFSESLKVTCTSDSYSGRAKAFNEPFSITGQGSENDYFAFDWPGGSNCSLSFSSIDGESSNSRGNILTNSGFDNFTGNSPNNFSVDLGTPGTNIFKEVTLVYDTPPNTALRLLGDNTTNFQLSQAFSNALGTSGSLSPNSQYSFNVFMRRDGVIPGSGVMEFSLVDPNGNVIKDNNNVSNVLSVDLTQLTTEYLPFTAQWRTPFSMPASYSLRVRLTSSLTVGRSVYLDKMSMGSMVRCYSSGPYLALHAGSIPAKTGDYAFVNIFNGRGSGGTLSSFQVLWSRFFPNEVYSNELMLPSSVSPTISDTWIS